ncbi:hypothetical protein ACLMLE_05070 [Lysobacter capsici]
MAVFEAAARDLPAAIAGATGAIAQANTIRAALAAAVRRIEALIGAA